LKGGAGAALRVGGMEGAEEREGRVELGVKLLEEKGGVENIDEEEKGGCALELKGDEDRRLERCGAAELEGEEERVGAGAEESVGEGCMPVDEESEGEGPREGGDIDVTEGEWAGEGVGLGFLEGVEKG